MPKATRAGASAAVPPQTVARVLDMHAAGETLDAIKYHLNTHGIVRDPGDGHPRTGTWTTEAVQALIDANGPNT